MDKFEGIFKISKDIARAKDLFEMAKESLDITIKLIPESLAYKLLVEYYEICVQLTTSLMYSEGYKTLNHVNLMSFLDKRNLISKKFLQIFDNMRRFRHGTIYYGRKESGNFYLNHKKEIKSLVKELLTIVENKIKGMEND